MKLQPLLPKRQQNSNKGCNLINLYSSIGLELVIVGVTRACIMRTILTDRQIDGQTTQHVSQ